MVLCISEIWDFSHCRWYTIVVVHISKRHVPLQLKDRTEAARTRAAAQLREAAQLAEVGRRLRSMQLNEQTLAGSGADIQHQARQYAAAALDLPRQASLLQSLCYVYPRYLAIHGALVHTWGVISQCGAGSHVHRPGQH